MDTITDLLKAAAQQQTLWKCLKSVTHLFLSYSVFTADTLRYAVTLAFDPLILTVRNVSAVSVTSSNFVSLPNFSEMEQSATVSRFKYLT